MSAAMLQCITGAKRASRSISRTSTGFIYSTDFSSLSGWTNSGSWTFVSNPSLVAFEPSPKSFFIRSLGNDVAGVREAQLFIISPTNWVLIYDAGDNVNGWTEWMCSSSNKGLTWGARSPISFGNEKADGSGQWATTATGWLEKRGSTYYLHRVTSGTTYPSPNVGLPGPPYGWDFITSTDLSSWIGGAIVSALTICPGSTVLSGGVYYFFVENLAAQSIELYSSSNPTASSLTFVETLLSHTSTGIGGRAPENPKVFLHPTLGYVLLTNLIDAAGTATDTNCLLISQTISGLSSATPIIYQSLTPIDSINAVGVATHVTGPDGFLYVDPSGIVPVLFDSATYAGPPPGYHLRRRILQLNLEPSQYAAVFNDSSSTVLSISRSLSLSDFVSEFAVEFYNTTSGSYVAIGFRQDGSGNGYQLWIQNGGVMILKKVVSGTISTVSTGGVGVSTQFSNRIKVMASGSAIQCWLNGELQINVTDASFSSGTNISFIGYNCNAAIRLAQFRLSDYLKISGLPIGSTISVRGANGLIVQQMAGVGTHGDISASISIRTPRTPQFTIDVDGAQQTLGQPLYGGDVLVYSGASVSSNYAPATDPAAISIWDVNQNLGENSSLISLLKDRSSSNDLASGVSPSLLTLYYNGQSGASFNGSTTYLTNAAFSLGGIAKCTLFLVLQTNSIILNSLVVGTNTLALAVQFFNSILSIYCGSGIHGDVTLANLDGPHIIAATFDGTQTGNSNRLKIYIDGAAQSVSYTGTIPATLPAGSGIDVGRLFGTNSALFSGYLFDLAFFSDASPGSSLSQRTAFYSNKLGIAT